MTTGSSALSNDLQQLAVEMFLSAAGAALVKRVAEILLPHGIPVMPLKGVLLQRLVYGDKVFRPISDVDILVPEARFSDAYRALRASGFTDERWEVGRWEVTLKDPNGPPLGVDLHRSISRTVRSSLTSAGMFDRGRRDFELYGAHVVLPCPEDLFAHLLQHATLDWINLGHLHRPHDFEAVAETLGLDAERCADHLHRQGLGVHALIMLPIIQDVRDVAGGDFAHKLLQEIRSTRSTLGARIAAELVKKTCQLFPAGHPARRLASVAAAPSVLLAVFSAAKDRLQHSA